MYLFRYYCFSCLLFICWLSCQATGNQSHLSSWTKETKKTTKRWNCDFTFILTFCVLCCRSVLHDRRFLVRLQSRAGFLRSVFWWHEVSQRQNTTQNSGFCYIPSRTRVIHAAADSSWGPACTWDGAGPLWVYWAAVSCAPPAAGRHLRKRKGKDKLLFWHLSRCS